MIDKSRHLITGVQILDMIKFVEKKDYRKLLLLCSKIKHEQYIGDSDKKIKEDLADCRVMIGD